VRTGKCVTCSLDSRLRGNDNARIFVMPFLTASCRGTACRAFVTNSQNVVGARYASVFGFHAEILVIHL